MTDLLLIAEAARERAHAPYSRFKVGAALRAASGRIYSGCNVENAAYPETLCAEAAAIGAMVAGGDQRIAEVCVVGSGQQPCTPCGGCRQRLAEFAPPETPVHMAGSDGRMLTRTMADLLPLAFGPGQLGVSPARPANPVDVVHSRAPKFTPTLGLVLGSGLGALADAIQPVATIGYGDLPGFPRPSVEGHAGRLILGWFEGVPVACLQGRVHLYEGVPAAAVNTPVRTLKALGCRVLLLTNAAGSLRPDVGPGSLVAFLDHINFQGTNPLVGPNDAADGPRFLDLSEVYDRHLREVLLEAAARASIPLHTGVYLALLGPCFETPAEIRAFRVLGADLVGMSTVPEALSARHAGLRVAAVSIVTNLAAGLAPEPLSHEETLREAGRAADALLRLLRAAAKDLADAAA
jgi:homotetrameric cytidine deaminase